MNRSKSPARSSQTGTPRSLGFRMPPEWHPHQATWLAWPKDPKTWPDRIPQVEDIYVLMMAHLSPGEEVRLLVDDPQTEERVRRLLARARVQESRVRIFQQPTADAWIRDYGPNFLIRDAGEPRVAFNDWRFNAWGEKYPELMADDQIPARLADAIDFPRFEPGMVLEGGAIDVNGQGVVLTTEQCLLNPNRNPGMSKSQIEQCLRLFLGIDSLIWLGQGITGDDTDGHVDDVARFVSRDTIVCCVERDPKDENFPPLQENLERLRASRSASGEPFRVVPLPMPGPIEAAGERLPASYANFYIANRVVLVPTFRHPNDRIALQTIQQLFPDRRVLGIGCEPLVWGLGAIHCVTQQQPRIG